jgi:hypothetical protein
MATSAGATRAADQITFAHNSERQFARLLDFYRVEWEYEPTAFPIEWDAAGQPTQHFRPDFYLPGFGLYIEITTLNQRLVTKKNRKVRRLRELYPDVRIKILYQRDYLSLLAKYGLEPPSQMAPDPHAVEGPSLPENPGGAGPRAREVVEAAPDPAAGGVRGPVGPARRAPGRVGSRPPGERMAHGSGRTGPHSDEAPESVQRRGPQGTGGAGAGPQEGQGSVQRRRAHGNGGPGAPTQEGSGLAGGQAHDRAAVGQGAQVASRAAGGPAHDHAGVGQDARVASRAAGERTRERTGGAVDRAAAAGRPRVVPDPPGAVPPLPADPELVRLAQVPLPAEIAQRRGPATAKRAG